MKAVFDHQAFAALGIIARRHRLDLQAEIMQPRWPGKPGIEGRIQHACPLRQIGLGMAQRQMRDERLRADADIAREQALEMKRRKARDGGCLFEVRLVLIMLGEVADRAAHLPPGGGFDAVEDWFVAHGRKMARPAARYDPNLAPLKPEQCSRARRSADRSTSAKAARASGARKLPICSPLPWLFRVSWLQGSGGSSISTRTQ